MSRTTKTIRRSLVAAGLMAIAACASAFSLDPQIMIDRALNSPTLTVRYTGAEAALVELKVNGESLGTRSVDAHKSSGETNFTVSIADLKDGDNEVEIRLFDRTGRMIGHDKTNISTEQTLQGPVFIKAPKMGQTIQGSLPVSVQFGRDLKNAYVSFFVDGNFKSMTNFPPFEYNWDTTRDANGWHELEAWAIDDSNETHKTRKVRVFVNNPGGRTDRPGAVETATPSRNPMHDTGVVGEEKGLRGITVSRGSVVHMTTGHAPSVGLYDGAKNRIRPTVGTPSGLKPTPRFTVVASGPRHMTPTGTRVAKVAKVIVKTAGNAANTHALSQPTHTSYVSIRATQNTGAFGAVRNVTAASTLLPITYGTRLPNIGSFVVVLNTEYMNFDVPTRVDNGVPMAPFRHLIEKSGGSVKWEHLAKSVSANADGQSIFFKIGNSTGKINNVSKTMEHAPYIDGGRSIVPLSFVRDALKVNVDYDKETGHVLITSTKK